LSIEKTRVIPKADKGNRALASPRPIRILLADDDPAVRSYLAQALQKHDDLEVVGQAEDGRRAVRLARKLQPDVVIMDGYMPKLNGIEATRQIVATVPQILIVGLSRYPSESWVSEMRQAGASAALSKRGVLPELLAAIRARRERQTDPAPLGG
jgi:DNA-binding NarL/FixJ family response regulator